MRGYPRLRPVRCIDPPGVTSALGPPAFGQVRRAAAHALTGLGEGAAPEVVAGGSGRRQPSICLRLIIIIIIIVFPLFFFFFIKECITTGHIVVLL